jgi:REP element-mobilizing transposase RayT
VTISPPKYKKKYRIASSRLKDWDYTAVGWYFITICTSARIPFFGEIEDGDVHRSPLSNIALQCWIEIPNHFSQASLDEFIIMPNHVHGIIVIHLPEIREGTVETQHAASLRNEQNQPPQQSRQKPLPKPGSISAIVRSYKSAVTRWAGKNGYPEFRWQARFYDHIILQESELNNIEAYIRENPTKWADDEYSSNM